MKKFLYTFISFSIILMFYSAIKYITKNGVKNFFIKIYKQSKKIYDNSKTKLIKFFKFLNIVTIFYFIILFFIDDEWVIKVAKLFFMDEVVAENFVINYLRKYCIYVKKYFLIYMTIFFVYKIIEIIYRKIKKEIQKVQNKKRLSTDYFGEDILELYKEIYRYFKSPKENRPILITGEWGVGKIYTINDFFQKYFRYDSTKAYKISCFGITSK